MLDSTHQMPQAGVAVAGCGHWGKNLARNFAALGNLRAICESDAARLAQFAELYPDAVPYGTFEQMLADPAVRGVAIATPAEQHHWMAIAALNAGKDVFVEKPLALEWTEGIDMVETARKTGGLLMVGHLLRYHPAILKIQELLNAGTLGKIEYIYSNRLSMGKIRREENALWSFAPHDISIVTALTGRLPVQVTATGGAYLQPNIADVTLSSMLFDSGARAHVFVSWLHPYKEQRLVVIGSKQMIVFEDSRPDNKLMLFDKRIELKNGNFEAGQSKGEPVAFEAGEPLQLECRHFIDCITTRKRPETPGEEGVDVLRILEACQRSLQMNGEPVQLSGATSHRLQVL